MSDRSLLGSWLLACLLALTPACDEDPRPGGGDGPTSSDAGDTDAGVTDLSQTDADGGGDGPGHDGPAPPVDMAPDVVAGDGPIIIGKESLVPARPRSFYSRYVNIRPGDGEVVQLNPPRFSWRYHASGGRGPDHTFKLQIASNKAFTKPVVDVTTPINFYNFLAPLPGKGPWYWRVSRDGTWDKTRSFTIAPGAMSWDRSGLAKPALPSHPRILFTSATLPNIKKLLTSNTESAACFAELKKQADQAVSASWWNSFPTSDKSSHSPGYLTLAEMLTATAFVWRVTGDAKYAGVVSRATTFASYEKGGRSSPEGAGGEDSEDSTQNNEFVALLYDWLYQDLSSAQRATFVKSLEWRTQYWMDEWAWHRKGEVRDGTLPVATSSHDFEGSMDTAVTALALYGDSPVGKKWYDFIFNYIIGVTNGMGFDESWNEGPGYGNSKMKWLMHATWYFQTAVPGAKLGLNPAYRGIGDFFARITPVGLPHSPWGNGSNNAGYYEGGRRSNFRKLAYLTGEGRFLRNWTETGGKAHKAHRLWIEYALPHHAKKPATTPVESDPVRLFGTAGWVTASSHSPSDGKSFDKAVGIIFQARPRGGFSHSFNSDLSFQIHAYGKQVNHGAGSSQNGDAYAYHTMSHNTVMIDGLGQAQFTLQDKPCYSRVVGFRKGGRFVYFSGDATWAYPRKPGDYSRWSLPLKKPYTDSSAAHLSRFVRHVLFVDNKYFVIYDDLAATKPAVWTWLYHILPKSPFAFDPKSWVADYTVDTVKVRLAHISGTGSLTLDDRQGDKAAVHPKTGEDWRSTLDSGGPLPGHALWVTSSAAKERAFLVVIYPAAPGQGFPTIKRIDDAAVQVGSDVFSFDGKPRPGATIVVQTTVFRGQNEPGNLVP